MLQQIEKLASSVNLDLGKLRVERWKADSASKQQAESNIDSVQRNLTAALPQFIAAVRKSPRDTGANFRLYRNLSALSDVLNSVTEWAGAFGPADQFQHLNSDLNSLDSLRNEFGKRVENLADTQTLEITQLRQQLQPKSQQPVPKKTVVDDNAPVSKAKSTPKKKPVHPAQQSSSQ